MSFDATKWVRAQAFTDPLERYHALEIADYADKQGKAFPSAERLAADTRVCERTVQYKLAAMEKRGILRREKRRRNGKQTSNFIYLAMMELQGAAHAPCETVKGAPHAPRNPVQGASHAPCQGAQHAPEPSKEEPISKKEPSRERNAPSALSPDVDRHMPMNGLAKKEERGHPKKASKEASKHSRGTTLPDTWAPSRDLEAYGLDLGFTKEDVWNAAEDMSAWAKANNVRKADWDANFKLWMRRNAKGGYRARPREKSYMEIADDLRREIERSEPDTPG